MKRILHFIIPVALLAASTGAALAVDPPSVINHQGRITVGGVNFAGPTGYFKFVLVDGAGTTRYWDNDGTTGGAPAEPGTAVAVAVSAGHYGVGIGDAALTNMAALDPDIFADNSDVSLRIYFSTAMGGPFEMLMPDIVMNSVGFSLNARKAQMVPDGAVTTDMLADGAVTAAKINPSYYNFMASVALGDPGLDSTDLGNGNLTLSGTFDIPFDVPPTVEVDAGPGAIVSFSSLTTTGFTADISGVEFVPESFSTDSCSFMTCAVVQGHPAFAYYNFLTDEVRYAYSSTPTGAPGTWSDRVVRSDVILQGIRRPMAMAVINGFPALCWHEIDTTDPTQSLIRYARAFSDATGVTGTWATTTVFTGTDVTLGFSVGLAEINGFPAVLFPDYNGVDTVDLVYSYSSQADGIPWAGTNLTLLSTVPAINPPTSSTAFDGSYLSFREVNGNPAFAYNIVTATDLGYAYSTTAQGELIGDWNFVTVDSVFSSGGAPSLAVVNGVPAIGYGAGSGIFDVKFAYGSDVQGAGAWNTVNVGSTVSGSVSQFASLAVVGGKPAIAHHDPNPTTGDVLMYSFSSDVQGISGSWATMVADSEQETGRFACLVNAGGLPGIAYRFDAPGSGGPFETRFGTLPLPLMWTASGGDQLAVDVKSASTAETVADGAISTSSLANGSVTAAKLAPGAFSPELIENNSLTSLQLAADSVGPSEIQDGAVSIDNINFDHGDLPGLGDDDHPQYLLANGSRALTSSWNVGNVKITNLADGTLTGDAISVGQIMSGDVTGAVPNNTIVTGIFGRTVSGAAPSTNQVLTWTGLNWAPQTPPAGSDNQTLALSLDNLSISGGNSVSLSQYLRSNASDSYTVGTMDFGTATTLNIDGAFRIGNNSSTDDDSIVFDSSTTPETLLWANAETRFEFTDELAVSGPLQVGSTTAATVGYSRFGTGATSHGLFGDDSLLITGILEVNGGIFADSTITGTSIGLTGSLTAGGSVTVSGVLHAGNSTAGAYHYFSGAAPSPISGDISNSGDLFVQNDIEVGGTVYGVFAAPSDRNIKEGFEPIEAAAVLEKVAALPITTWRYKERGGEAGEAVRHMGPVAQDFSAAFGLGESDRHIATIDANGVALAAIQALKAESDAKDVRIAELEADANTKQKQIDVLVERLERLEKAVGTE